MLLSFNASGALCPLGGRANLTEQIQKLAEVTQPARQHVTEIDRLAPERGKRPL